MSNVCIFQAIYGCKTRKDFATKISDARLEKVKTLSLETYSDDIYENIKGIPR